MECYHEKTEKDCEAAPGLPQPQEYGQNHEPLSKWWASTLWNGGCSWDADNGSCNAFTCEHLQTEKACHLAAHPKMPNMSHIKPGSNLRLPIPKHCLWDKKSGGSCARVKPDQYCEMQLHPQKRPDPNPGPPMPPSPPEPPSALCAGGEGGLLCNWDANSTQKDGGRCVPTHCEKIHNATECSAKNSGYAISCAWVPAPNRSITDETELGEDGRCIVFDGNCSVLPSAAACNLVGDQPGDPQDCGWNATGPDHSGPKACMSKNGHGHGPMGGWEFNCSNAAWYGLPGDGSGGAAGGGAQIPNGSPGQLTLGTPVHYWHTLAAGVSVWNESAPATQLGIMVKRMAEPYSTPIAPQEIFKYWESNIAGAPLFPNGLKMLVGEFAMLFGTEHGRKLQEWCKKEGWVLSWALGATGGVHNDTNHHGGGDNSQTQSAPYANRTLDLSVLSHTSASHNLTVSKEEKERFERLWKEVAHALNATKGHAPPPPGPPMPPHPDGPGNHSNHTKVSTHASCRCSFVCPF